jgi:phage terminase large subunit GpA-like protein
MLPSVWAEEYRRMSSEESAMQGRFRFNLNPYLKWLLDRYADPAVRKIVCQKSAQIGWTQSVICNLLGYFVHIKRTTAIVMFPKELTARNFDLEKFRPMVESTPALNAVLPVRSRSADVKTLFKKFSGGFIKFVGSNSIADVKSTSARDRIVEEPDDCNLNLRGQGDAIKLLSERGKSYRDGKELIGGTPSIEGASSICAEMELSDKCYWEVPCPDCGTFQRLVWEQVQWQKAEEPLTHPVYGRHRPDTARYACIGCGSLWTNAQKNLAVQRGKPVATAPFTGVVGLYLNELYSLFAESRLERLVQRYLEAKHEEKKGNTGDVIVFQNAALGLPYRYKGSTPDIDQLKRKALPYALGTVPHLGLMLAMGVDVQHNRLAIIVRAFGQGEESWLVHWEEIPGNTVDPSDDVWSDLERLLLRTWPHQRGWRLRLTAASIDSGDGQTNDAVYAFVRRMKGKGPVVMATKGSSSAAGEIFSKARVSIETNRQGTKASRYGLRPYIVGTDTAKDLLLGDAGRAKMLGAGPARFHFPEAVDEEYLRQLTSEIKVPRWDITRGRRIVPTRTARNLLVWVKKTGVRNEVLDCEILALHAARSQRSHTMKPDDWQAVEAAIAQQALWQPQEEGVIAVAPSDPVSASESPDGVAPPMLLPGTRKRITRSRPVAADDPHLN